MNRGSHVMQKSPVQQQMMGGSPNWWNMINNMRPPIISHNHHHHQQQQAAATHHVPSTFLAPPHNNQLLPHFSTSSTVPPSSSLQDMSSTTTTTTASWNDHNQDQLPESWSQLLLGGLVGEEDKSTILSNMHQQVKKLENNWEEQLFLSQQAAAAAANSSNDSVEDVKQKNLLGNSYDMYDQHGGGNNSNVDNYFHQQTDHELATKPPTNWSQMMPVSSPKSCVTTLSSSNNNNSMLDFSNKKSDARQHPPPDHSSECNSRATGGAPNKKARVQPSSTQSTFKVRKEKLGDRITALHQLVSPFGKTDTASVLLEAIGYIRFLQSQIEALSLPYLGNGSANMRHQQQSVQDRNNLFPEDPGQLSNDNCLKRKITSEEDYHEEAKKDLRSRGLCLVPISCTLQVGSDNGADYWAPALGGGFR